MRKIELPPMRRIFVFMISFAFSVGCGSGDRINPALLTFADRLHVALRTMDVDFIESVGVYPDSRVTALDVEYLFGSDGRSGVANFIQSARTLVEIYGPYSLSDGYGRESYTLVFYSPDVLRPDAKRHFPPEALPSAWGKGYLEAVVTIDDGIPKFHRAPFYSGAHLPWLPDY